MHDFALYCSHKYDDDDALNVCIMDTHKACFLWTRDSFQSDFFLNIGNRWTNNLIMRTWKGPNYMASIDLWVTFALEYIHEKVDIFISL